MDDGDHVILINNQTGEGKGLTGTLVRSTAFGGSKWFIRFDEEQPFAHTGDGSVPQGYGWFVELENVALAMKPYDPTQGNEEDDI